MGKKNIRLQKNRDQNIAQSGLDFQITIIYSLLVLIGLVMVSSASTTATDLQIFDHFYLTQRHAFRLILGLILIWLVYRIPIQFWYDNSMLLMLSSITLLVLVLIPGLGRTFNGSTRWLDFGLFSIQVSEVAILFLIIYLSGYLTRRSDEIEVLMTGFLKPMCVLSFASGLINLQPDFGATALLLMTGMVMMYLGGVHLGNFLFFTVGTLIIMVLLAISSPYRLARITSFVDPWGDPLNSGYQLTQSLIAIGSGGLSGNGIGGSVQKLFYLPEANTHFLFSVYVEETGFIGSVILILLFLWFLIRSFQIGKTAMDLSLSFAAYLVYGIGLLVTLQVVMHVAVNMGSLPTKGLDLPFISYGGNSLLISSFIVGIVLRAHYENTQFIRKSKNIGRN